MRLGIGLGLGISGGGGVAVTPTTGFVFDGDSLTWGYDGGSGQIAPTYPMQVGMATGLPVTNLGVSGRTLATMLADYDTNAGPAKTDTKNTLVILAGINDLLSTGATDATLQGLIQSYCAKAKTSGYKVMVGTVTPTADTGAGYTPQMETYRLAYNTWLRSNYRTFADGLVDFASVPALSDPTNATYFFADKLHFTPAGASSAAQAVQLASGVAAKNVFTIDDMTSDATLGGWLAQAGATKAMVGGHLEVTTTGVPTAWLIENGNEPYFHDVDGNAVSFTGPMAVNFSVDIAAAAGSEGVSLEQIGVSYNSGFGFQTSNLTGPPYSMTLTPTRLNISFLADANTYPGLILTAPGTFRPSNPMLNIGPVAAPYAVAGGS